MKEMRRYKQSLSKEEIDDILRRGTSGVLALCDPSEYPYALPISYAYDGKSIYFHCAVEGHKLDILRVFPKASFCVIDQDEIIPEKYTTKYRSVIAFGTVCIVEDEDEIQTGLWKLAEKYAPDNTEEAHQMEISHSLGRVLILRLDIAEITGKAAIELIPSN